MKQYDRIMTPDGMAIVKEIHAKGKSVKVEMLGSMKNGVYTWPKPLVRIYTVKQLKKVA